MKRMGLAVWLCAAYCTVHAQTSAEWLQQKKTRIRYLTQQVAAFQVYLGDLKKGYRTVKNGLNVINDLKHGDFDLHHDYFNSLSSVSNAVRVDGKVERAADLESKIIDLTRSLRKLFPSSFLFAFERNYLTATIDNLLEKCSEDMDKLNTVTTSDKAQMTEARRFNEINTLYQSVQDKYSFAVHLKQSTQSLLRYRSKEKMNASTIYSLYGLK